VSLWVVFLDQVFIYVLNTILNRCAVAMGRRWTPSQWPMKPKRWGRKKMNRWPKH